MITAARGRQQIMSIQKTIDIDAQLTEKQKKMFQETDERPIVFDDDLPELDDEQLKEFKRISEINRQKRRKQTVTLRLSPQAL